MKLLLMYPPSPEHLAALAAAAPGARIEVASDGAAAARAIVDADAVLGNRWFLQSLPHAGRLGWMQSNSVGVDRILESAPRLDGIVLTCSRGVYDDEIAEHAVALVLALSRGIHLSRDGQRERTWVRRPLGVLSGRRALVLGWGGVGRGIASRLAGLRLRVEGVRRRHAGPPAPEDPGFVVHGPDTWKAVLPQADVVVAALPRTRETRGILGARELASLPADALVVNVGRGGTVHEAALLEELRSGRLGGAALDVVEEEPPPADHPIWAEPRLLVTPHVARSVESAPYRWEPLFVENVRRRAAGEPLLNVVDRDAGY